VGEEMKNCKSFLEFYNYLRYAKNKPDENDFRKLSKMIGYLL